MFLFNPFDSSFFFFLTQHQNSCSGQVAVTCIIINTFHDKKVQGHGAVKHVKKKDTKLRTFPWYINQDNDIMFARTEARN